MRRVIAMVVLATLAPPSIAKPSLNGWSGKKPQTPCLCRHSGGKAALGEKICQMRNGKMVTLRCDLVLNNTNWTKIADGCDVAAWSTAPFPRPL